MTARRASFRAVDLRKALVVARESGLEVTGAAIQISGEIRLQFRSSSAPDMVNEWDEVLRK